MRTPEAEVDVGPELVVRLVDEQFPEFSGPVGIDDALAAPPHDGPPLDD